MLQRQQSWPWHDWGIVLHASQDSRYPSQNPRLSEYRSREVDHSTAKIRRRSHLHLSTACQVFLSKSKNVTVAISSNFRALIRHSINTPRCSLAPQIFNGNYNGCSLRFNPGYWRFISKPPSHFGTFHDFRQ